MLWRRNRASICLPASFTLHVVPLKNSGLVFGRIATDTSVTPSSSNESLGKSYHCRVKPSVATCTCMHCRVGGTGWTLGQGCQLLGSSTPGSWYLGADILSLMKSKTRKPHRVLGLELGSWISLWFTVCESSSQIFVQASRSLSFLSTIRKSSLEGALGGQLVQPPAQSRASFHQATQAKKARFHKHSFSSYLLAWETGLCFYHILVTLAIKKTLQLCPAKESGSVLLFALVYMQMEIIKSLNCPNSTRTMAIVLEKTKSCWSMLWYF